MRLEIKRRTFLKGGALAATGAVFSGCFRPAKTRKSEAPARFVPSYCEVLSLARIQSASLDRALAAWWREVPTDKRRDTSVRHLVTRRRGG